MSKWATLTAFSLAQVYVAETLSSGLPVAVKVQYADLRERFDSDVATFKAILDGIEVMHPKFGFAWILDELSENMENELDFQVRPQCPVFFFAFCLLKNDGFAGRHCIRNCNGRTVFSFVPPSDSLVSFRHVIIYTVCNYIHCP